jgi:TolA-binding protein
VKKLGQIELKVLLTPVVGVVITGLTWVTATTWARHEASAAQALLVAHHSQLIKEQGERLDALTGQVQRMEAASSGQLDAAKRLEAAAMRFETYHQKRYPRSPP